MMTCEGLGKDVLGSCSMSWFGLVILFFVGAAVRKWVAEEMSIPFEFWFGLAAGVIADFITMGLSGSFKLALFVGLLAMFGVGFGIAYMIGGGSDSGGDYS